eukprot:750111-Hanusia_phi.AAC.1
MNLELSEQGAFGDRSSVLRVCVCVCARACALACQCVSRVVRDEKHWQAAAQLANGQRLLGKLFVPYGSRDVT